MKTNFSIPPITFLLIVQIICTVNIINAQESTLNTTLDDSVKSFFEEKRGSWKDWNVPESDGKILYDIIIKNNYKHALEIGSSTGHSGIWIAWALSKTGGKLITIEINEDRYQEALANFKEAGLAKYIDARLADALLIYFPNSSSEAVLQHIMYQKAHGLEEEPLSTMNTLKICQN